MYSDFFTKWRERNHCLFFPSDAAKSPGVNGPRRFFLAESSGNRTCEAETGRCYWLTGAAPVTWEECRTLCQSEAGDLAVIETQALWNFVTNNLE